MIDVLGAMLGGTIFFTNLLFCLTASSFGFLWLAMQWENGPSLSRSGLAMFSIGCFGNFATTASLAMEGIYRGVNMWELTVYGGATLMLWDRLFGDHLRHRQEKRERRKGKRNA